MRLRRRCLCRRRCASERAFLVARLPRTDAEDEEEDESCFLLRVRFPRGDFDLEREVERCLVFAGRLPRGDLDLEGDVERCLVFAGRLPRGDLDLEGDVERCLVLAGRLPRGDLDLEGDVEVDGAGDSSPRSCGLCGAEVRPAVTPTSWLGVGDTMPEGITGSTCRGGRDGAVSDKYAPSLDESSSIGDGTDPETDGSWAEPSLCLTEDLDLPCFITLGGAASAFA